MLRSSPTTLRSTIDLRHPSSAKPASCWRCSKKKLNQLVADRTITAAEAELPDLGPLPEVEDSPPPGEDEEEEDEDEEEEDEEDEDEDSDDEGGRRRRRRRGRMSGGRRDRGDDEDDSHKKRGRPPRVFTPLEARINAILKGIRRPKNDDAQLRVIPFEKLPDKAELPDYYETVRNPIALDMIKRKAKRKKYQNVDQLMSDLELMFENAKEYNEEGSSVYEDAVELQKVTRALAEQEKAKSDEEFRDDDGKLPLASIEHRGELWRVGKCALHDATAAGRGARETDTLQVTGSTYAIRMISRSPLSRSSSARGRTARARSG